MKRKYILQICFLFILIFTLSATIYAEDTQKKVEKQNITTETQKELNKEETSPLEKELATVPNQTDEITDDNEDWLNAKETARDREINRKLKKRIIITLFYLVIVVILIFIVLKFLGSGKINIPTLGIIKNNRNILQIKERMFLQQGKVLYLIKAGEKNILIGVSENNINYLTDVNVEDNNNSATATQDIQQTENNSYFSLFPQIKPIENTEILKEDNKKNTDTEKNSEE